MDSQKPPLSFKFILIGDSSVGKTSLCKMFCEKSFDERQQQTVALEFGTKTTEIEGTKIKLQIWDTAGQERFHSITRAYFRGSTAVFLVFDIASRASFTHLSQWVDDAQKLAPAQSVKVLVGNKSDLSDKREVSTAEAQDFAETHSLSFFETSALSGDRVDDTFMETAHAVYEKMVAGKIDVTPPPQVLPVEQEATAANAQRRCQC